MEQNRQLPNWQGVENTVIAENSIKQKDDWIPFFDEKKCKLIFPNNNNYRSMNSGFIFQPKKKSFAYLYDYNNSLFSCLLHT